MMKIYCLSNVSILALRVHDYETYLMVKSQMNKMQYKLIEIS